MLRKNKREKMFGVGRCAPLDRNAKVRIVTLARALSKRTDAGKHYGLVTAKFVAVLEALLWGFHNSASGRCFPSYEAIAAKAGCARSTVYEAIRALERAGLLTWANRLIRVREACTDLFGKGATRWRVLRTSNAYVLIDPKPPATAPEPSKSDRKTGTTDQSFNLLELCKPKAQETLNEGLATALSRLRAAVAMSA